MKTPPIGPKMGTRVKINKQSGFVSEDLGKATVLSPTVTTVSGALAAGSAIGTTGLILKSGGTGLISTGPQSSCAASVLDAFRSIGLPEAADFSIARPIPGGIAQILLGIVLGGSGASSSCSCKIRTKSPS